MTEPHDHPSLRLPDEATPVLVWTAGVCQPLDDASDLAVLPGAFNPLHEGHRQLRQAAAEYLAGPVTFELSIQNVDKPQLSSHEVHRRLQQMADASVLLTSAALFAGKAGLFPGAWFVVGYDTAERVLDPRYYQHDIERRDQFLQQLLTAGVRFLVGGRVLSAAGDGRFRTGRHLSVAHDFRRMFVELPGSCFRVDISSTAIRERQAADDSDAGDED